MKQLALAVLSVVCLVTSAWGNPIPGHTHPGITRRQDQPQPNRNRVWKVAMTREHVDVKLAQDAARVAGTYWLVNLGAERETFLVRFPADPDPTGAAATRVTNIGVRLYRQLEESDNPAARHEADPSVPDSGFEPTVKLVSDEEIPGGERWYEWLMVFEPGERQQVVIEYDYGTLPVDPRAAAAGRRTFTYRLDTGAAWAGRIAQATIDVHLDDASARRIDYVSPAGASCDGKTIAWKFEQFEPNELYNIRVNYGSPTYRALGLQGGIESLLDALRDPQHPRRAQLWQFARTLKLVQIDRIARRLYETRDSVQPNAAIALMRKRVQIALGKETVHVKDMALLKNRGGSHQTFVLRLPRGAGSDAAAGEGITNLTVTVDGQPVRTEIRPIMHIVMAGQGGESDRAEAAEGGQWFQWYMAFSPGQAEELVLEYDCPTYSLGAPADGGEAPPGRIFIYRLDSSAGWAGRVGEALIEITLADDAARRIDALSPAGASWQDDSVSWTFTDFEPTAAYNIAIRFDSGRYSALGLEGGIDGILAALKNKSHKHWSEIADLAKRLGTKECRQALGLQSEPKPKSPAGGSAQ